MKVSSQERKVMDNVIYFLKQLFMFFREFAQNIVLGAVALYTASKGSPLAFIAGVVTVLFVMVIYLLIIKVLNERKIRRREEKDNHYCQAGGIA
jgi:membrane protein YdbS with pleckstrin-like domain